MKTIQRRERAEPDCEEAGELETATGRAGRGGEEKVRFES